MILPEDKTRLQKLTKKTRHLWRFLDCDKKKKAILELEDAMSSPSFWNDQNEAKRVSSEANQLKQTVEKIESFRVQVEDLEALAELCDEDEDEVEMAKEFLNTLETLLSHVEDLEVASFLGEPFDDRPALLSIHAGAGGTESCDWADMLMRMYMRWAERRGFKVELQDLQPGEEAGSESLFNQDGGITCLWICESRAWCSSIGSNQSI
jgi:peptide chain release factor 2